MAKCDRCKKEEASYYQLYTEEYPPEIWYQGEKCHKFAEAKINEAMMSTEPADIFAKWKPISELASDEEAQRILNS